MKHGWAGLALMGGAIAMAHISMGAGSGTAIAGKPAAQTMAEGAEAIRPFSVHVSDEELADLGE